MAADLPAAATLAAVRAGVSGVSPPGQHDKVWNDECVFSFDTPLSADGLYVSLQAPWQGVGASHLRRHAAKRGCALWLHVKHTKTLKPEVAAAAAAAAAGDPDAPKPAQLSIGLDGGFLLDEQKFDVAKDLALAVVPVAAGSAGAPVAHVPLPCAALPEFVLAACAAVAAHDGGAQQAQVATWNSDSDARKVSKYAAGLEQQPKGGRAGGPLSADASTWVCGCDANRTDNLWLNLGTGCVRRFVSRTALYPRPPPLSPHPPSQGTSAAVESSGTGPAGAGAR